LKKRMRFVSLAAATAVLVSGLVAACSSSDNPLTSSEGGLRLAATTCVFDVVGTTMTLTNDCTTDETIFVPDGVTLDGAGYTITAVDPAGNHFRGAVVENGGATAYVVNLTVTASALANVCDGGDDRLRGIMFEGASGTIAHNTVVGVTQAGSGCQEGNSIEVRNAPFDGTHPNTQVVEIAHNDIDDYMKTGIVANGDVDVLIHHNTLGASANQANLAANGVQYGFGGTGSLTHNQVDGNSWCCVDAAATAVLLFEADGVDVVQNNLGGNADVGIYNFGDGNVIDNNKVFESGPDGFYDVGIGDYGANTAVTNNKVRGYAVAYDGVNGGKNKVAPGGPKAAGPAGT